MIRPHLATQRAHGVPRFRAMIEKTVNRPPRSGHGGGRFETATTLDWLRPLIGSFADHSNPSPKILSGPGPPGSVMWPFTARSSSPSCPSTIVYCAWLPVIVAGRMYQCGAVLAAVGPYFQNTVPAGNVSEYVIVTEIELAV